MTNLKDAPRLTIGLPVFNGENYIEAAIRSILAQTFDDFELLISDNASTDLTAEICTRFSANDPRVIYERQEENVGAARNFNILVERVRTPLFKWAAHDDILKPTYLERCVGALDSDEEAVLAHSRTIIIDEGGDFERLYVNRLDAERAYRSRNASQRFAEMIRGVHACFEVFGVIRTSELRKTQLIGPYKSSDRTLLAELALRGRFVEVPEPLFLSRDHEQRSIRKHSTDELNGWFDPARTATVSCPAWRLHFEFGKAILRTRPGRRTSAGAFGALAATTVRRADVLLRDVVHAGRILLQRRCQRYRTGRPANFV